MTRRPTHPTPAVIAAQLERTARNLRTNGTQAGRWATLLAARGYPTATIGNGTRTTATATSVERAVGLAGPDGPLTPPDPQWTDIDAILARLLRLLFWTAVRADTLVDRILAHATTDDPIPGGTGPCALRTCEHFCNPRKKPSDRLRRGLCPSHYNRWLEAGQPDLATFARTLTDTGNLVDLGTRDICCQDG